MTTARIITTHVFPPIPDRSYDWQATREDWEPGMPAGFGPTEADTIADLLRDEEFHAS